MGSVERALMPSCSGNPGPNAAQYTALLKAAYPAIKAADPDAVVVAASVGRDARLVSASR